MIFHAKFLGDFSGGFFYGDISGEFLGDILVECFGFSSNFSG